MRSQTAVPFRIRKIEGRSVTSTDFERNRMREAFHRSIVNRSFVLHYQPQICMTTRKIRGFEAVVRWIRDDGVLVPPLDFIPLAEETGLIEPLGEWILNRCAADYARIRRLMGTDDFTIAVKCSRVQFRAHGLADRILSATRDAKMHPHQLELEIGEDVFFQDPDWTGRTLNALRDIGVLISVKDFGASHFCLAFLRRFPLDHLRIRRTLINALPDNKDAATIVQAILGMAQALGLRTIAEGVERKAQLEFLRAHGCDTAQGFVFCPPMPLHDLREFLVEYERSLTGKARVADRSNKADV